MRKIAFLGMGLMGSRMASRLLAASYEVSVWNRTASACEPLVAKGATQIHHFAELATADTIMLCVSDDSAVEAVAEKLIDCVVDGQIIIDFSSITPKLTTTLSAKFAAKNVTWLDIPVSGGVQGAEDGSLVMFVGGDADALKTVEPVLSHLSARVTHMGGSGSGQVTKLCNQLIVAANSALIAEAVALADASGVDTTKLAPALTGGFADSKPFQILTPRMAEKTFTPVQWKVATLHKDITNAVEQGEQAGVTMPVASMAKSILSEQTQQRGQEDLASIILGVESSK